MIRCNRHIHCIGIGGAGMSGLAELVRSMGCVVTGSDREKSAATMRLQSLGIDIQYDHEPRLITSADLVIYSSAIGPDSLERRYAAASGIQQMRRAEVVGDLMRSSLSIGVAGTHGKTTTTALAGHLLQNVGANPTLLVGGAARDTGANAQHGDSGLMVVEADEYDRSFLVMHPTVAIITNIDAEHLDCYGNFASVKDAFVAFAGRVPFYGCVVACIDDPGVREILPRIQNRAITYGFDPLADFRAEAPTINAAGSAFTVVRRGAAGVAVRLAIPGRHNVLNALAALAATEAVGVAVEHAAPHAVTFQGVKRRFEVIGSSAGITIIDDYAHHPTEIKATLAAARAAGYTRIVLLFQPHLFSRTRDFMAGFIEALGGADVVFVSAIYQAREEAIPGVSAQTIVEGMQSAGHADVRYVPRIESAVGSIAALVKSGDAVITMGAGDVWKTGAEIVRRIAGE